MSSAIDLCLVEKGIDNGFPEIIVQLCEEGGAEHLAAQILAADPAATKEFGGDVALLASYLRSRAAPQRRDAERALRDPKNPPRLSALPSPAAALHAFLATTPQRSPTPARSAAAATVSSVASAAPPPAHGHSPSVMLAAKPAPGTRIKLGTGPGGPCPFDRAIVAQHPDRYCL